MKKELSFKMNIIGIWNVYYVTKTSSVRADDDDVLIANLNELRLNL